MFDVKMETVEITDKSGNKEVYNVGPLTGEYLEDLYALMDAFKGVAGTEEKGSDKENSDKVLKILSTDVSKKLHGLVFASLVLAYPSEDKEKLNQFASQNMMAFLGAIIKVNMPG